MLAEIERFVNHVRRRNPQARTWRDYQYDLAQFAAQVGPERALGTLQLQDIDAFILVQADRGFKPATINRRLAAIASLFTFLSDEDPNLVCPVLTHRHSIRQPQRLPRPVPAEDLTRFLAAIEDMRDRAMVLLMLRCGLRISEVASLKVSDLYLRERQPRLHVSGKGSRERVVYLSAQAERALRAYLAQRPKVPSDFLFVSYLGGGLSTTAIHKRLMRYRQLAGVTLSAHRLRHTFANDLLNADMPVTSIQKLLGHSWIETTQTYVAANDRQVQLDLQTAVRRLESWQ